MKRKNNNNFYMVELVVLDCCFIVMEENNGDDVEGRVKYCNMLIEVEILMVYDIVKKRDTRTM